jgi:hypothetical protein
VPGGTRVLHLNDDVQIVEILNDRDRPVADGEVGQVVVTQLCCLGQPLLRYRLGDFAAKVPGCAVVGGGWRGSPPSRVGPVTSSAHPMEGSSTA